MNYKKMFLPAIFLLLVMAYANAAITVTVNVPTASQTFYPNLVSSDKCVDINYTVLDTNGTATLHWATIYYNHQDGNKYISSDVNINGGAECTMNKDGNWGTDGIGATCHVTYCWETDNPQNGDYVLDINVTGGSSSTTKYVSAQGIQTFNIDNRYVSTSVEGLINTIPIVLVGVVLIVISLTLLGYVDPKIAAVLLPGLIIALIAIVMLGQFMLTLTGY